MFHINLENPIIELFMIRNDSHYKFPDVELFRQDPFFNDLPENTKIEIFTLSDALNSHKSLSVALSSMPFHPDYDAKVIEILHKRAEKGNLSDFDTFCFLFQCLSWISLDSQNQTVDSLVNLIEIFKSTLKGNFCKHSNAIFQELVIIVNTIQKESLFKILIDPIINQIQINSTLNKNFYPTFLDFIIKIQNMIDKSVFSTMIPIIAALVADQRHIFEYESLKDLAYLISREINDLDMNALYVLCFCSCKECDDEIISDLFLSIPHLIYQQLLKLPVFNKVSDFKYEFQDEADSENKQIDNTNSDNSNISPDMLIMPNSDIIENKVNLLSLCDPWIHSFIKSFLSILKLCGKHSLNAIMTSLCSMKSLVFKSEYCIDFIIITFLILKQISKKCKVHPAIGLILNQFTFCDNVTIFTKRGLTDANNRIRNDIFKFVVRNDEEGLHELFIRSSSHPLLYAELLMRATFQVPLSNEFYSSSMILPSLIGATMLVLQSHFPDYVDKTILARSIIFNVLFRLFDEPETALRCFENHIFSAGFLSLIFEPGFSNLIVRSLSDCLSKFPVLPEPVSLFVASLFKMCSLHHDEQLSSIATNLAHEIIRSISHNISIGPSFEAVFDSTLEFLQLDPNNEMLESVLSMLLLIAQGNLNLLVNSTRFNNILNLIHSVEGDEPSDTTFLKMQNLMNASTNIAMNMMFLVRIPDVLALVLIAFSKSKRLSVILEKFMNLCTFSMANIYACHDGDVDLILLKSLFGSFTYKKRKVEFDYGQENSIIESHVMKLISQIVTVRSSFTIDNLFLSLLLPNENGEYSKYADLAVSTLNSIFLAISKFPSPIYPIASSTPYLKYDKLNPEGLDKGFIFAFYCYIDVGRCMTLPYSYNFVKIIDSRNFKFSIFYHKKGMYARFEGNGFRTSAPLAKEIPSNEWIWCLVIYEEDRGDYYITLKVAKEDGDEVDFKKVDLQASPNDNNNYVQCNFCFMEEKNAVVPADQPAPVMMGDFYLITGMPSDQMFESLRLRGSAVIQNLDGTAKVVFSHNSTGMMMNTQIQRQNLSICDTMIKHLTIEDFLPIFAALEKAPKLYAESIINAMGYCIDYSNVVYTDTTPSEDETKYLDDLAEITFSEPLPPFPRELQKLSSISVLAYLILTNSRELINFQLFTAFFSQMSESSNSQNSSSLLVFTESEKDKAKSKNVPIIQEFIENVLFSPFYWCSVTPNHMKRICNKWCSAISRGFRQANETLFEIFLVQTHLLVNFSTKKEIADTIKVLSNSRFQTLEAFAMTKSKDTFVSLVIGMIFSIIENINEKVRTEVIHYLNFLIFMSETPCKAFNDDAVMALLSLVDIFPNDPDIFYLLMVLYQKADSTKTMQRVTQLSIRFFSLKKPENEPDLDTSNLPLDVQCIRAIIRGDNDEEVIQALQNADFSILSFMWFFWPTIVGLVRPKTMAYSIELLSRYPKEFGKITTLFSMLKVFQIFKMKEFRKHYIETLSNRIFSDYLLDHVKPSSENSSAENANEFTAMSPFDSDLYLKEESDEKMQIDSVLLSTDMMNPLTTPTSGNLKPKEDINSTFSNLILPFFLSHFYKYSSKPFSSAIITEMAKNSDFADISNIEQSMKIELSSKNKLKKVTAKAQNVYSYPTGTFNFEKLLEIFSTPIDTILEPLEFRVVYRPAESQTLYELCKDLTHKLQHPLSDENEKISTFINTPKNSEEYPTVAFNTFTYMEQNVLNETAQQSLLKTISNVKSILIVNTDRTHIMKKYKQSVWIQRKHFYEFVTYGRVKSTSLLSHHQSDFLNASYYLQNPFIELAIMHLTDPSDQIINENNDDDLHGANSSEKASSAITNSGSNDQGKSGLSSRTVSLRNQLPKLDDMVAQQQQFICSFQAKLLKFSDHFIKSNINGTKVIFELFSDRIVIEFEDQTPLTIFFSTVSIILINEKEKLKSANQSSSDNLVNSNSNNELNSNNENENNDNDNNNQNINNNENNEDNANNGNNDSENNDNKPTFNQGIRKFIKNLGLNKKSENGKNAKRENKTKNDDNETNEDVYIEIFNCSLQSYLFQISLENKNKLIKINKKLGLLILTCTDDFISKRLIPAWNNGNISTFDFLLALSILQGRSFNRADQYPFFPSPSILEYIPSSNKKHSSNKKSDSTNNSIPQIPLFNKQQYLTSIENQVENFVEFYNSISKENNTDHQNIQTSQNIKNYNDVMPEFYFKFGCNNFDFNGKNPYQNRKLLENIEYRKIIGKYASDRFGMIISGVPRFTIPSNRNNMTNTSNNLQNSDEKCSTPYINLGNTIVKFDRLLAVFGKYDNHFVYLEENGTISLSVIDWRTFKFIKTRNFVDTSFTDSVVCASGPNSLVFYDMPLNKMLKIMIDSKEYCNITVPPLVSYYCPLIIDSSSKIKIVGRLVIAVIDKTSIISCPIYTFPKHGIRLIYDNKEDEIIKFEVHNRTYNTKNNIITKSNGIIVFLTKSGLLKAVSLSNGLEVNEFNLTEKIKMVDSNNTNSFHDVLHITNQNSFDDGKKVKILITDSLSLIIVTVGLRIFVFTPELSLIKMVPIIKPIISWTSYSMYDGIDYIVYVQSDFMLCSFEAYYPEKITSIEHISLLSTKNQSQNQQQSQANSVSASSSSDNLSNNLADTNPDPQISMKNIRSENMIAIFSKSGLIYAYYHPKMNVIPLTLSL